MASKDVFDQIRDLESFIDDFVAETTDATDIYHDEKTEVQTETVIYQKPDEKTLVEEEDKPEKTEEKVLVETPLPLSMLDYDLNLSDDFSTLVTQFKVLTVSPVDKIKPEPVKPMELVIKQDPVIISVSDSPSTILHLKSPPPQPQMRRNSVSSKKSQKSTKSSKSFKSARRHVHNKQQQHQQQQQQQQQQKQKEKQKYIPRSYDEMMRIPDIYERISFYDKTLDLCLKADSPVTQWSTANQLKGKPQALIDGYSKDILSGSSSYLFSPDDSNKNASTTFGSSLSLFLKKATSTQSFQPTQQQSRHNSPFPQTSHSLFGRSMSRFQLSRSTQLPKHDHRILLSNNRIVTKQKILSPLSTLPPMQTSASTPTKAQDGLAYLMNILPQIDIKILQSALEEAKGDPMVAISIAVSKDKSSPVMLDPPRKKKPMLKKNKVY